MNNVKISSNRSFGIVFFIVFLLIALYPLINSEEIRVWSLIISLIFLVLGLINSKILSPLNNIWFKFGLYLGKVISPLIMRILGKDVLNLRYNDNKTYWIEKTGPKSKMKNQF